MSLIHFGDILVLNRNQEWHFVENSQFSNTVGGRFSPFSCFNSSQTLLVSSLFHGNTLEVHIFMPMLYSLIKQHRKRSAPMRNPLNQMEIYYGIYNQPWKQLGDIPVFTRLNWGDERMNITPPNTPPTTPPSLPWWVRPMDAGRHTGTQQWSTHCIFIQAEQAAAQPSHSADQRQKISPLHRHSSVHLQTRIVLHVATHAHILAW